MTPKEEAKALVEKYYDLTPNKAWFNEPVGIKTSYDPILLAKQCAIIAVDIILEMVEEDTGPWVTTLQYWQAVKEEILKM